MQILKSQFSIDCSEEYRALRKFVDQNITNGSPTFRTKRVSHVLIEPLTISLSQTIFSWVIIISDKMIPLKYQTTSPLLQKEQEGMGVGPQEHHEIIDKAFKFCLKYGRRFK